ncbi:MAG: anaerobic ribonucleoside-triphosphate reductase activating protein [Candidatus Amulumruptor caecigallinarius]|nr:anaerobic ribonucleoside-triphosphate reductase activating protein [Candidatus Amulumruptor caecigallinarius]
MNKIRVLDIIRGTTVDGPGFRTSIYFAGCRHQCPGCHNPQSWNFSAGVEMTIDEIMDVVDEEDFDVTFSGGDPMYHPETVRELSRRIVEHGHKVWVYTGFTYEEILANPVLKDALQYTETIVEGPFIEALRDTDLLFRGSSNQRIIKLH